MRIAYWSPTFSGPSHTSVAARANLASLAEVGEVVHVAVGAHAPSACVAACVRVEDYRAERSDLSVYEIDDAASYHAVLFEALRHPGIAYLRDVGLRNLYRSICGSFDAPAYREELRYNVLGARDLEVSTHEEAVDSMAIELLARRVVESSFESLVGTNWAVSELHHRSPDSLVSVIAPPTFGISRGEGDRETLRVLALIAPACAARIPNVVEAVRAIRLRGRSIELTIAAIDGDQLREIDADFASVLAYEESRFDEVGEIVLDNGVIHAFDLVIAFDDDRPMRVPTAVYQAMEAGIPVAVLDGPQYVEFAETICRRLPSELRAMGSALISRFQESFTAREALGITESPRSPVVLEPDAPSLAVGVQSFLYAPRLRNERELALKFHPPLDARVAVNAIGSWAATTGLAEAARRTVSGLLDAGVDVAIEECDVGAPSDERRLPSSYEELPQGRPFEIDLCFLNLNEIGQLEMSYLRRPGRPSYVVGVWYWELPSLPADLIENVRLVDEIWVASSFVGGTLSGYTSVPIHTFPAIVEPKADESLDRSHFELPEESCLYLFNFDAQSTFARKNPWAVIEAFRQAFPNKHRPNGPRLVVKTINLDKTPEGREELRYAVERVNGILIEDDLRQEEMASLISLCDVYVSLHRSEGFGLGMAEAMYFGKPVVATAYSGNEDFMSFKSACPVGYTMTEVTERDLRFNPYFEKVYEPGQLWASPDIPQAARWMRLLYERPKDRLRLGNAGSQLIREMCSKREVGGAMRSRLFEIERSLR